jgi:hypothetical protein
MIIFYVLHIVLSRAYKIRRNTMKFGLRTPSLKKSISARTTGKAKRAVKKALIPGYGKKGTGLLHPKKAIKNKIYKKTTFSIWDLFK